MNPRVCVRACRAQALDLADRVGTCEVGKEFDALLIDTTVQGGPFDVFDDEADEHAFEKFINLGDDRNLVEVYVQVRLRMGRACLCMAKVCACVCVCVCLHAAGHVPCWSSLLRQAKACQARAPAAAVRWWLPDPPDLAAVLRACMCC